MIAVIFLQSGSTSLHVAGQHGHVQVVKMLIRSGADVNVVNKVSSILYRMYQHFDYILCRLATLHYTLLFRMVMLRWQRCWSN